jgi:hypothetical protein
MLHAGAREVTFDDLRQVETPAATKSHVPIPHHRLVDTVRHSLSYFSHEVIQEHHGITPDGLMYFGVMMLQSAYGGYEDAVALRNSHNKRFPIGIGFGGHVFCCDNMSLIADQVIKRKHTANAKRDLPGLVAEMVEPLADARDLQQRTFQIYRATEINATQVDHAIMEMYRQDVLNVHRIADVYHEWVNPSFEEMTDGFTAWRLFNAATFALRGKVLGNPVVTQKLHNVIDSVCMVAAA